MAFSFNKVFMQAWDSSVFLHGFLTCFVLVLLILVIRWIRRKLHRKVEKHRQIQNAQGYPQSCKECTHTVSRYRKNIDGSVTCANCVGEGK